MSTLPHLLERVLMCEGGHKRTQCEAELRIAMLFTLSEASQNSFTDSINRLSNHCRLSQTFDCSSFSNWRISVFSLL